MTINGGEPTVTLVGAGVVGTAVLKAHLCRGITVRFCDIVPTALDASLDQVDGVAVQTVAPIITGLATRIVTPESAVACPETPLVIESVAERLDVKRELFSALSGALCQSTVFCSNTSSLPIRSIADSLACESRLLGLHFFMPVDQRPGLELVRGKHTSQAACDVAFEHAKRIGKTPIVVGDGHGFVVNRMLAPYLGKAMELVTSGATALQIERAALRYGMPLSPLELIDVISVKTTIEAGRGYWSAFPQRMNPSPIVAGLYKRGRYGRESGGGFYDYVDGKRSDRLSPVAAALCEDYTRESRSWTDQEVEHRLAMAMWIESRCLMRDGIVKNESTINQAMEFGLGYRADKPWSAYFQTQDASMLQSVLADSAMRSPDWLNQFKPDAK